jgi:hypothetical protein
MTCTLLILPVTSMLSLQAQDILICIEEQDMFLGLMIAGSQIDDGASLNFICIGEAIKTEKVLCDNILPD